MKCKYLEYRNYYKQLSYLSWFHVVLGQGPLNYSEQRKSSSVQCGSGKAPHSAPHLIFVLDICINPHWAATWQWKQLAGEGFCKDWAERQEEVG